MRKAVGKFRSTDLRLSLRVSASAVRQIVRHTVSDMVTFPLARHPRTKGHAALICPELRLTSSGHKRERDLGWSHESVKAKNVDEHRAKKEQPERDVSVGEHEQATDQLSQKDDDIEM